MSVEDIDKDAWQLILQYIPYEKKNWLSFLLVNKHFYSLGLKYFDPSVQENYAIRWASENGHIAVVERLLQDKRVDPSADDNYSIRYASSNGHTSVVERLLQDERVDPSAKGNFAIQWASECGHISVVERLLEDKRVDPSADNNFALRIATEYREYFVVGRLLEDERVNPSANEFQWTSWNEVVSVIERLLQDESWITEECENCSENFKTSDTDENTCGNCDRIMCRPCLEDCECC